MKLSERTDNIISEILEESKEMESQAEFQKSSKVAYFNNIYGMAGCERTKVTHKYFESYLEALLPPIAIFKMQFEKSTLSPEMFERLIKLSPED